MKIIPTPTHKGFIICDETEELLDVYYQSVFSSTASTNLEGTEIKVGVQKALFPKYEIIKNNVISGAIDFKLNGTILIQYFDETMLQKKWKSSRKGFSKRWWEITDESGLLYLTIKPHMDWRKFKYAFTIEQEQPDISKTDLLELLIYCGYAINLQIQKNMGAA